MFVASSVCIYRGAVPFPTPVVSIAFSSNFIFVRLSGPDRVLPSRLKRFDKEPVRLGQGRAEVPCPAVFAERGPARWWKILGGAGLRRSGGGPVELTGGFRKVLTGAAATT